MDGYVSDMVANVVSGHFPVKGRWFKNYRLPVALTISDVDPDGRKVAGIDEVVVGCAPEELGRVMDVLNRLGFGFRGVTFGPGSFIAAYVDRLYEDPHLGRQIVIDTEHKEFIDQRVA
ncbi:hypothetical protein HYY74_02145 [Candidatus Woesearchaeota archaeon]|nr:hypothetical protein [Candidatus Woesearchaeota archaeon]